MEKRSGEFFNARDEIMDWMQSKNQAKEIQSEMIVKLKQQPHNSSNDNNIEKKEEVEAAEEEAC